MSELLLVTDANGVRTITLNRPQARNALSMAMLEALKSCLAETAAAPEVKVVVLAGAGPAFCAGHDLKELQANPDDAFRHRLFQTCSEVMLAITRLPKPVIAQVHGIATAAGCQLAATCDLAYATTDARFATPGVNIGLFCSTPMVALSRAVGRKAAMQMLLTGDMISAAQALQFGLVNGVVDPHLLVDTVQTVARQIAGKSPLTLAIGKEAFYAQAEMGLDDAYAYTAEVMVRNMAARDAQEGIGAFLEKRAPVWQSC